MLLCNALIVILILYFDQIVSLTMDSLFQTG